MAVPGWWDSRGNLGNKTDPLLWSLFKEESLSVRGRQNIRSFFFFWETIASRIAILIVKFLISRCSCYELEYHLEAAIVSLKD